MSEKIAINVNPTGTKPYKKKSPSQSKNPAKQVKKNVANKAYKQSNMMNQVMTAQAQMIVESVAAPREAPAVRLGAVYGTQETVTARPFSRVTPGWVDQAVAGQNNDTCCFVFRDPYCAYIVPQLVGGTNSVYSASFSQQISGTPTPAKVPFLINNGGVNGTPVHGTYLFPGRLPDQRRSWWYIGPGAFSITNTHATNTLGVQAQLFKSDDITTLVNVNIAPGTTSTIVNGSAVGTYISIDLFATTAGYTITANLTQHMLLVLVFMAILLLMES